MFNVHLIVVKDRNLTASIHYWGNSSWSYDVIKFEPGQSFYVHQAKFE